jgi:hypothetical protein
MSAQRAGDPSAGLKVLRCDRRLPDGNETGTAEAISWNIYKMAAKAARLGAVEALTRPPRSRGQLRDLRHRPPLTRSRYVGSLVGRLRSRKQRPAGSLVGRNGRRFIVHVVKAGGRTNWRRCPSRSPRLTRTGKLEHTGELLFLTIVISRRCWRNKASHRERGRIIAPSSAALGILKRSGMMRSSSGGYLMPFAQAT